MKVYIAGPIAGQVNQNREAFLERADLLRSMGHEPVNPHDIPPEHTTEGTCCGGKVYEHSVHEYGCFLREDIKVLMYCDAITLLPGWQDSKGAATEEHVARSLGLPVVELVQ
jgi:nucleoside 2-deoxyribosyltransferase